MDLVSFLEHPFRDRAEESTAEVDVRPDVAAKEHACHNSQDDTPADSFPARESMMGAVENLHPIQQVLVVSHERSGTHFLLNSLAEGLGSDFQQFFDLDFPLRINFYDPENLGRSLVQSRNMRSFTLMKSHHVFDFFQNVSPVSLERIHVFYVYRDPRDVMVSFRDFCSRIRWDYGPRCDSPGEFMRSAPSGGMLRYQKRQEPSILHRWLTHVSGWLRGGPEIFGDRFTPITFEGLGLRYEETMGRIGAVLRRRVVSTRRPSRTERVVLPGRGTIGSYRASFTPEDLEHVRQIVGPAMERHGLVWDLPEATP